ncbi:MAG: UPF0149 family protein [Arenicellales bacterium]
MSPDQQTTSYVQLQAALDLAALDLRASEVHGMVCGQVCRQLKLVEDADSALSALMGLRRSVGGGQTMVMELVDALMGETWRTLDAGIEFNLLLPDDDEPVAERAAALADWARGFVLALLCGEQAAVLDGLQEDGGEFVQDLIKISEARAGGEGEEDERALVEIEEYVRVGVQLVFEEMQPELKPDLADGSLN